MFSLLGTYGYRYANSVAVDRVLRQLREPHDEIIPVFAAETPPNLQEQEDGVFVSGAETCWGVKMGARVVLLPRSWDESFYDRVASLRQVTIRPDHVWRPARFGRTPVSLVTIAEAAMPSILRECGGDVFGAELTNGEVSLVFVDRKDQEITAVVVSNGLER